MFKNRSKKGGDIFSAQSRGLGNGPGPNRVSLEDGLVTTNVTNDYGYIERAFFKARSLTFFPNEDITSFTSNLNTLLKNKKT